LRNGISPSVARVGEEGGKFFTPNPRRENGDFEDEGLGKRPN